MEKKVEAERRKSPKASLHLHFNDAEQREFQPNKRILGEDANDAEGTVIQRDILRDLRRSGRYFDGYEVS
ncbi:hypothetical protein M5K25_010190 [Dendrobium thyrsiflorum]|uniref:Uncharacterized protein n=1 Tax=Dendrobium thyrsiflorum TaxID=117978 RepID=A0ABD0V014_DENTH